MIGSKNAILNVAEAMARHAATRQATLAENLAQANTPGYRAKDVAAFDEAMSRGDLTATAIDRTAPMKPNGNTVQLESQVRKLAEARGQHDMALGLWERTLSLYEQALGRR